MSLMLLYIFGGLEFGRRSNTMIALDLKELKWRVINENDDATEAEGAMLPCNSSGASRFLCRRRRNRNG